MPRSRRQAAVIDIGSNSVRLVIYRIEGRAIWTLFNEKALAGLGRDLASSRRLSPEGVETALKALRRFKVVLGGWETRDIAVVATAAVRDARDGMSFVQRVMDETGLQVRILSGEEEARYAALGVVAGHPNAAGIVGDLGGSSLELTPLSAPGAGVTLPLGPFALGAPRPIDIDKVRRKTEAALSPLAKGFSTAEFHAVGGAWRNLGLLHMAMADYPLHVAHQYEMSRSDAIDVARFVARQSRSSLEGIDGLSKKRFDTLPYAAVVLEALIEKLAVQRVVVSAFGLREGLLFEAMSPEAQATDPLIEGCEALTSSPGAFSPIGPSLEAWVAPIFRELENLFGDRDPTLIAAACRLADLGARLHPDHRADLAFDQVLRAPIAGMSHAERAFLACAAFSRHTSATSHPEQNVVARLLSPDRRLRARTLGAAVRLGCDIAGRNPELLSHLTITLTPEKLALRADSGWEDMLLGEQTIKRATTLAQVLRVKLDLG
ncbi:MAG: exopolyphosphatase [Alphaproteobacteria bacterium PA2]|nr:MAG: exopolyphosphatase [Alphaproteobacteria bacterium PA2]